MDGRSPEPGWLPARVLRLLRIGLIVGIVVLAGLSMPVGVGGAPGPSLGADRAGSPPSQSADTALADRYQAPEDALAADLALIAQARGWTAAEVAAYARAEAAVDRVAAQLAAERPEAFVGSALALDPGGTPRLFIAGPIDPELLALAQSAAIPIEVVDGQPSSFVELEAETAAVHAALLSAGYREVVTTFDITRGGLVEVTVRRQADLPYEASAILSLLPAALRAGVEVTVRDMLTVAPAGPLGVPVATADPTP